MLGSKDDRWWDCVPNRLLSDLPLSSLYSDDESEPVWKVAIFRDDIIIVIDGDDNVCGSRA